WRSLFEDENWCTQRDANWGAQPPDTGEAFLKIKTGAPRGIRTGAHSPPTLAKPF
ncbi:MAG: hypothetical protein ACI9R8_000300, partial [Candidatus Paceibacteria bacterium]